MRWITPMPPACAMAIAMRASVTVSIAELSNGMFRRIDRVTRVETSACEGSTLEAAGTRRTSSKVRASRICMGDSCVRGASLGTALWHGMPGKERGAAAAATRHARPGRSAP